MSCNLRGSTHKRMDVTLSHVQREVINLISLKLQCSNKLRGSRHSSNCQFEIYRCKLRANGQKWLPTHLTARTGFWSQAMFTQIHQFEHVATCQHLIGLFSFLKTISNIIANMPNLRKPLKISSAKHYRPLEPAAVLHFHQVTLHYSSKRCLLFSSDWVIEVDSGEVVLVLMFHTVCFAHSAEDCVP